LCLKKVTTPNNLKIKNKQKTTHDLTSRILFGNTSTSKISAQSTFGKTLFSLGKSIWEWCRSTALTAACFSPLLLAVRLLRQCPCGQLQVRNIHRGCLTPTSRGATSRYFRGPKLL